MAMTAPAPALPATTQATDDKRALALLKAVGLDKVAPEQREIALAIADRYELDLLLGHLVLIDGKPYVTHRGLLHVAHRSQLFDGIELTEPRLEGGFWRCTATVWRKDMGRGFTVPGRYPEKGRNGSYAPEMSMVRAECLALRRAFDVAAPVAEERWAEDAEQSVAEQAPRKSLSELARSRAEAVAAQDAPQQAPEPEAAPDAAPEAEEAVATAVCGAKSPYEGSSDFCRLAPDHKRTHKGEGPETW